MAAIDQKLGEAYVELYAKDAKYLKGLADAEKKLAAWTKGVDAKLQKAFGGPVASLRNLNSTLGTTQGWLKRMEATSAEVAANFRAMKAAGIRGGGMGGASPNTVQRRMTIASRNSLVG